MSSRISTFRDVRVWQQSIDLLVPCYRITRGFPADERFGLTSQLRRAALSVSSNIAEGNGRKHRGEYVHHVSIAKGSLDEVESLLVASERLGFLSPIDSAPLFADITVLGKGVMALMRALERRR